MIRRILSILTLWVLAACSAPSAVTPVAPTQVEKPAPAQSEKSAQATVPIQPGTLANSILAVLWQGTGKGHFSAAN